ncbi:MAG: ROK family protein [Pseudoruegeria sp.]
MKVSGIDLGGTKMELQLFDEDWKVVAKERRPTPNTYGALVTGLVDLIAWGDEAAGGTVPVGIGAAGLLNPQTGLVLTANLCASGQPLPGDVATAIGRDITYINDCRALALSEAVFGAGQGHHSVMSLILGTGVGGGSVVGGELLQGPTLTGGEFGHTSAPAHLLAKYNLPLLPCGCGRQACVECYISGPGMEQIAKVITGKTMTAPTIAALKHTDAQAQKVWEIWCDLTADLILSMTLTADPDVIVIGGGLSKIEGICDILHKATATAQIGDFGAPPILLAQGGDASGARGAAYAAVQGGRYV